MSDAMREALTAAYDKHAAEAEEAAPVQEQIPEAPAPEAAPEKVESAATEAPTPPVKDGGEKSPPAAAASPAVTTKPHDNTAPVTVQSNVKPPRSWSAEAKAAFAALPEPVKQDVLRREKEISQGLEHAAPRAGTTKPSPKSSSHSSRCSTPTASRTRFPRSASF